MKKPGLSEAEFWGLFVNAIIARGSQPARCLDIISKIVKGTNMKKTPIQSRKFRCEASPYGICTCQAIDVMEKDD
jgi:hypothetical protein